MQRVASSCDQGRSFQAVAFRSLAVLWAVAPVGLNAQSNESYYFATAAINEGPSSFVDKWCGPDMLPYTADDLQLPVAGNTGGTWGFSWIDSNGDGTLEDDERIFTLIRRDDDDTYSFVPEGFPQYGALKEGENWIDLHEARNNGQSHAGANCPPEEVPGCLGDDFEHNDRGGRINGVGQPGFEGAQNYLWYNNDRADQRGWGGSKYYFELKNGVHLDEMEGFIHWLTLQNNSDDPETADLNERGTCRHEWMRSPELVVKGLLIPVADIPSLKRGDLDPLFGWYSGDMADYVRDALGPKLSDSALNTTANNEDCALSETQVKPTHLMIRQVECPIKINAEGSCADQALAEQLAAYWGIEPLEPGQPETAATYRASNVLLFNDTLTQVGGGTSNFITQPEDRVKRNLWVQDYLWRGDKNRIGRYTLSPEPTPEHPAQFWTVQDDSSNDVGCGVLDHFLQLEPGTPGYFQAPLDATLKPERGAIYAIVEFGTRDLEPPGMPPGGAGPVFQIILLDGDRVVAYAEVSSGATSGNIGGLLDPRGLATNPNTTKAGPGAEIPEIDPAVQFPTFFDRFIFRAGPGSLKLFVADNTSYSPTSYEDLDGLTPSVSLDSGVSRQVTAVRFATSGGQGTKAVAVDDFAVFQNLEPDALPGVGPFVRSDCNGDGGVDISDAVCTLDWLFLGGQTPGCIAVTNANGDGAADISDATYLLNHLFLGGPPPVEPFPECGRGTLSADEGLGCQTPPRNCVTAQ